MLAVAVLASWLAQAEPAPTEPSAAKPAAPLVVTPPPEASPFDKRVAVYGGLSRRLGPEAKSIGPTNGPSFGGSFARRYFASAEGFDLDLGLDFFYDQFETGVLGTTISQTSFALTQTAGWRWRRLHPFAQVAAGVAVGYVSIPNGNLDSTQPLVRGAAGLDVAIKPNIGLSLRVAYTILFSRPIVTTNVDPPAAPMTYSPLGDLLDVDLGVVLLF
jgi:hypothetical protein